jgi:uncharacterized glyoxalase superfamily protein PhnB
MAVIPMLSYEDGAAAIDWLTGAFGFSEQLRFQDDDGTVTHAELETGSGDCDAGHAFARLREPEASA